MQNLGNLIHNLEQQIASLKNLNNPQALQQVLTGAVPLQQAPPAQVPVVDQEQSSSLSKQQEMLLAFYDEFANTDDGKALAASLNKFARFVQSKVDKK